MTWKGWDQPCIKLKTDSLIGSYSENCYTFRTRMSAKWNNLAPLISEHLWGFTLGSSMFTQICISLPHSPICFAVLRIYSYSSLTILYCFPVIVELTLSSSPKKGGKGENFVKNTHTKKTQNQRPSLDIHMSMT